MRYNTKEFPLLNDIVYVKIVDVSKDNLVSAKLIEYNDMDGLLIPSEISKRYVSARKLFSPDKVYACIATNINKEKKYVDLSYKRITDEDRKIYNTNYSFIERIIKLGNEINVILDDSDLNEILFENTIRPIFDNNKSNYDVLYHSLLEFPISIFKYNTQLSNDNINKIINGLATKITISELSLCKEIKLRVISENAIQKLKNILTENIPTDVSIEFVSSPTFKICASGKNTEEASNKINNCLEIVEDNCKKYDGVIEISDKMIVAKEKKVHLG